MKRLGVIGTMVWDTIYGRSHGAAPIEEWGGIAYALASLEASLPADWEIVPLIKVGRDLAPRANGFLASLTRRSAAARFIEVPEPNNRVTLHYQSATRRTEQMAGGVPGWTWSELGPMVGDLDALYINFISGFELSLDVATFLRHGFSGPIYADLHSLLLGVKPDGFRTPQPLDQDASWFACFDAVQVNEDELSLLGEDPMTIPARALAAGTGLFVVTLGARGAVYFAGDTFRFGRRAVSGGGGPVRTARVPTDPYLDEADPTGCGDVFGAALVAALLEGEEPETAVVQANRQARRNLTHHGATNLSYHLRGEIAPR